MTVVHPSFYVFILLLLLVVVIHSSTVQVKINYPEKFIQPLQDGSIFDLWVCYLPGCPTYGIWNTSGPTFTVYVSDRLADNIYAKNVTLSTYVGNVWVAMSGSQNATDGTFSISTCDMSGGCNSLGVPYMTTLGTTSSVGIINAYPWFNVVEGKVYTMFKDFYSPQLGVYRDINVYIPPSMSQNSLTRHVNIIILNDGDTDFMTTLSKQGGLDRAIQNGDVPQDTIMIGVPQNLSCERGYELTYEPCNPNLMVCIEDCPTGGGIYFTYFLRNTVIPAVLTNLSMYLGEVSMTGSSLGGLTSCAAASFQPAYFQRGFCMSPSTWWNAGGLATNITENAIKYGLPKSIVMYIGTEEATQVFSGQEWMVYYNQTMKAWIDAGLSDGTRFSSFSLDGGQHLRTDWVAVFAIGITRMYLSDYTGRQHNQPYSFRQNQHITYPTTSNYTCNTSDDVSTYENIIIGFGVVLGVIIFLDIAFVAGYFTFYVPYLEAVQEARVLGIDLGARVSFYSHMKTTLGWSESESSQLTDAEAPPYVPPSAGKNNTSNKTTKGAAATTKNPMLNKTPVTQRTSLTAPKRPKPSDDQML